MQSREKGTTGSKSIISSNNSHNSNTTNFDLTINDIDMDHSFKEIEFFQNVIKDPNYLEEKANFKTDFPENFKLRSISKPSSKTIDHKNNDK